MLINKIPPHSEAGSNELTNLFFLRVFWRPANSRNAPNKNDTKTNSLKISELKSGVVYECVVNAANTRGASALTEPTKFSTDEKYITSAASIGKGTFIYLYMQTISTALVFLRMI